MKSRLLLSALFLSVLLANSLSLRAQKTVYWKGGTPGMESNWNCPGNWSSNTVPDVFSNVIIPDVSSRSRVYPVFSSKGAEINKLTLEAGSSLTIQKGSCLVVSESVERLEITDLNEHSKGNLIIAGSLIETGVEYALGKR